MEHKADKSSNIYMVNRVDHGASTFNTMVQTKATYVYPFSRKKCHCNTQKHGRLCRYYSTLKII